MRAKRKRAVRKPVSKKPSTGGQNEETKKKSAPLLPSAVGQKEDACLNFENQNNKENSRCEDSNDYEVGQPKRGSGNDIQLAGGGSSSSSSESDESFYVEDSSSDDSSIGKRSSKLAKGHGKAKQKSRELSKKEGKENYNSSRVLRSSSRNQKEFMTPTQVLQCNNKDLRSALAVIKKVMQMDEAQPFNVPVDPDALGKHDYLDVIDNPMDFGTICRMLQNNVRYTNSEDVFQDVKLIWENCCKYHKKGEYIVYLVKRVKKKFMKYWKAADLGIEQSRKTNGNLHLQTPVDHVMRQSRWDPVHALGNVMDGTRQVQQNRLDPYQLHMQVPPFSYNQFYQPQQPLPTTMSPPFSQFHPSSYVHPYQLQHPQPSSNQPQHSQLPHHADCSSAGHSHFQPSTDSVQNYKNYPPRSSLGPMVSGPANQPQPLQPQLSHTQPCVSQQPQQSTSKLQQSRLQCAPDTGYSHLPPQTDGTRDSGYVPPMDSVVVSPCQQHPQQSPLSNGQLNEPQQLLGSHGQPQSWLPANGDIENSQVSLTDSAMRGIRCALRYSAGPVTDNPSQGDEDQLGPAESHPEHSLLNQNQETQSQQQSTKKMKRVRGPTRCLFLRDLPEGQRIIVPFDNQGRPVGSEAAKLSSFLGTIARDGHRAPLTFFNWKEMPDSYKEDMWHLVQEKFDVDPSCKAWVLRSLAIKWNNWKTDIKAKHYYPHKTDEECLKDCPPRIVPDQWPVLISYWKSDSVKMVCAINKANRAKQKGGHTSGQKSYARILEEERRKRTDGKEPTRAELYILTHTRKDGQPIDEIAATTISKLLEAKKQKTSECSDGSNDTFCQAIEEENPSPIHSDGLGPTNDDDVHGQKPNGGNLTRMKSHARKSGKKEVSKVLEKINAVEQKYDRIENQIAALTSNMQKFLDKLGGLPNTSGSEQVANP
ncbi:hypothetical protein SLA2020_343570 [Shorea laevis]